MLVVGALKMTYILFMKSQDVVTGELDGTETPGEYCQRIDAKQIGDREYRTREQAEAELQAEWKPQGGFIASGQPTPVRR